MSIEDAREALKQATSAAYGYVDPPPVREAIEALIVAHLDARLSPAPVGGETVTTGCGCVFCDINLRPETGEDGKQWHLVRAARLNQYPEYVECNAPTPPPAEPDGGDAGAAVINETVSHLTARAAEAGDLRQQLAEAHADARAAWDCCEVRRKEAEAGQVTIADLEQRLAGAKAGWDMALATIAERDRRIAAAVNELHCCDDLPLNIGLAGGIAALREARDAARALLTPATDKGEG